MYKAVFLALAPLASSLYSCHNKALEPESFQWDGGTIRLDRINDSLSAIRFEKKGVLYDKEDDNSVIPVLDKQTYERYRLEGRIDKGMVPKLDNAFGAMQKGASRVVIKHALDLLDDTGTILEA
jgi:acetylglutamate kinase